MAAGADDDAEVLLLQGHACLLLAALRRRIQRKKRKNLVFGFELYLKQARSYGVAWGGKCHPCIIGCQLFATPGNFSAVLNYCPIL